MMAILSPALLARTYRDPLACLILLVDLFPLIAVIWFGWRAEALLFLYWLENLVIGGAALYRVLLKARMTGQGGWQLPFLFGPFFVLHYGLFCYVHGLFLHVFAALSQAAEPAFLGPPGLIDRALDSGQHMPVFIGMILALELILLWRDNLLSQSHHPSSLLAEMVAPYGRIIVLHFALFAGAACLILLGSPLVGVLGLILLRAAWGVYQTQKRRYRLENMQTLKVDPASQTGPVK